MNEPVADFRCYRHADRDAYIKCQRCERFICPECMTEASVGFQCPSCLSDGQKSVRTATTVAGAKVRADAGRVSMAIIAINVIAQIVVMGSGGTGGDFFVRGAMWGNAVADGEWWRLLTSAFLHGSLLHIAFNMYALYLFGPLVERALGPVRFILTYLTLAVGASVFVYWLENPRVLTIGASGAVFGLFGIALVLLIKAKQDVRTLLILLGINAYISLQGNISWQGHLGGFVIGCLLGLTFAYAPRDKRQLVQTLVFVGLWLGIVVAVVARTSTLTL